MGLKTIVLKNEVSELEKLSAFITGLADEFGLDEKTVFHLDLVCDELVTNTILYGYDADKAGAGSIRVQFRQTGDGLELELLDDGRPFDPLSRPEPDTGAAIEERAIGGLGIHFVRQVMDDVCYERQGERNVLLMKKRNHIKGD